MTLSTTVSTSVSQGAITRITRLFNGTLLDVLNELFQNGWRGAASQVAITTVTEGGRTLLCVADDGTGPPCRDPILVAAPCHGLEDGDRPR